jgi:acetyltransferase-like isoleucine patch superfamily enzyme
MVLLGCVMKIYFKIADLIRIVRVWYYRFRGVTVGKKTLISFGAWIDTQPRANVIIGNRCVISNGSKILAHDWAKAKMGLVGKIDHYTTTIIEDFVFIGMNSIILSGIRIGEGAIVGAGAVVTRDVPPYSLVVGNPARVVRSYDPTLKEKGGSKAVNNI